MIFGRTYLQNILKLSIRTYQIPETSNIMLLPVRVLASLMTRWKSSASDRNHMKHNKQSITGDAWKIKEIIVGILGGIVRAHSSHMGVLVAIILVSMSITTCHYHPASSWRRDVATGKWLMTIAGEPLSGLFIVVRAIRGGARSTPMSVSIGRAAERERTIHSGEKEGKRMRDDGGSWITSEFHRGGVHENR